MTFIMQKKEALTLPGAGVQFPVRLQQSIASNNIIHRFSEKVNMNILDVTQSQQFKRWFGDWRKSGSNYGDTSKGLMFFTNKKDGYPDSALDYAREASKNGGTEKVMAGLKRYMKYICKKNRRNSRVRCKKPRTNVQDEP